MLNIAHRGASGSFPENTLCAFRAALVAGADMCELDIRLTRDGELVVCHDPDVERTTEGHGAVASMTLEELKRLDAGVKFDSRFAGERIPTLDEVFDVTAGRCGLNIELKAAATEKPVCEIVRAWDAIGTTLVSSFDWEELVRIRRLAPEIRVGLLASRRARQLIAAAVEIGAYAINPRYDLVSAELCTAAHKQSLRVYAWTTDELELMRKLINYGVDGIMTNYPERLRQLVGW